MAKQTAAQKAKAPTTDAPETTAQTATAPTDATPQSDTQTTSSTILETSTTPSLFDQAVAFSMGALDDEAKTQAARALWDLMGCEALPPKLAVAIFDCAHAQDPKVCERLLGKVGITRDGGEYDTSALDVRDIDDLVRDFLAWRLRRYAFTAAAATRMLEWSQHILALQALTLVAPEETPQA